MTAPTIYVTNYASPHYTRIRLGLWKWWLTDGLTGPTKIAGTCHTERGVHRCLDRAAARCVCVAGDVRCDRPVLHPLTPAEAAELTARLAADGVPVTVLVEGPGVVLWRHRVLTVKQEGHALHVVLPATDAPVRWAGAVTR